MVVIGVNARTRAGEPAALGDRREAALTMSVAMHDAVARAGAAAWLLPALPHAESAQDIVARCAGLILQGGPDIAPSLYDRPVPVDARDAAELELIHAFIAAGKPILGICRGCQLLNVAFGGTLYADLPTQLPSAVRHSDPARYVELEHAVNIVRNGYLHQLYGRETAVVNSAHHQGIRRLGDGLEIEARSADGLIEAFRARAASYVVGLQWHPEFNSMSPDDTLAAAPLFADFVEHARRR